VSSATALLEAVNVDVHDFALPPGVHELEAVAEGETTTTTS
jgi:hypothetical protein